MLKKLFYNERFTAILWVGLALATILQNVVIRGRYNNYLIFEGVFNHTLKQLPLFIPYPEEYGDMNHYGVFFRVILALFEHLP